jgi:hypothetical protein
MQSHNSSTHTDLVPQNALEALLTQTRDLQALPECLSAFCASLAKDLPRLEARALPGQVQDLLRPGQDLARACPRFLAHLLQDPLWGLTAATNNRTLRQLAESLSGHFQGENASLHQVLPTLIAEAGEELAAPRGDQRDRRVLRAIRLIWAASWRGPRCQALAAKACRKVWGRQSGVARGQRSLLLEYLQNPGA